MKKILIIALLCLVWACGKKSEILFCEGVSPEGEGERCGVKFEAGDLTALIKSETPFEADKIDVVIYEISGQKERKVESLEAQTGPGEVRKAVNISMYRQGKYRVKAEKQGAVLAQGDIEIVE